jgi:uncharacterized protein YndB with AHSA1/START domain
MISAAASVFINRPIEDVFEFTTAMENVQKWQADVTHAEFTSNGLVGVGTTGILAQKVMGREISSGFEVTVYEPPYQLCFRTTAGPVSVEGCQTCEEQDSGTLFTMTMSGEAGGFFKVAEGMLQGQVQKSFERDLNMLKQVMEG